MAFRRPDYRTTSTRFGDPRHPRQGGPIMTIRRFVVPSLLGALFVASLAVGSGPLREPAGGPAQDPDHLTIRETPPPIDDPAPSAPSSEGAPSRLTPAGVRVLDASGLSGSLG